MEELQSEGGNCSEKIFRIDDLSCGVVYLISMGAD